MREALVSYFEGERGQGWFWLGAGAICVVVGIWLLLGKWELKAMGWPLVLIGAVELLAGFTGALNEGRVALLLQQLDADAPALLQAERDRLAMLATAFTIMKVVEIVAFLTGGAFVLLMPHTRTTIIGIGIGLVVQGATMLSLETVAARRAQIYRLQLDAVSAPSASRAAPSSAP